MTHQKVIKYLQFLISECARYVNDRDLNEDYIDRLNAELVRFKSQIGGSELDPQLVERIYRLDIKVEISNKSRVATSIAGILLGWMSIFVAQHQNKQAVIEAIELLRNELNECLSIALGS